MVSLNAKDWFTVLIQLNLLFDLSIRILTDFVNILSSIGVPHSRLDQSHWLSILIFGSLFFNRFLGFHSILYAFGGYRFKIILRVLGGIRFVGFLLQMVQTTFHLVFIVFQQVLVVFFKFGFQFLPLFLFLTMGHEL